MLNSLIDNDEENINQQNKSFDTSGNCNDCSWCIFCDLTWLFICCLE